MRRIPNRDTDLWKRHAFHAQIGVILSLLVVLVAVQVRWSTTPKVLPDVTPQETITIDEVNPTTHTKTPPPPPRPLVPVEVPVNEIIEGKPVEIESPQLEIEHRTGTRTGPPDNPGETRYEPFVSVQEKPNCGGLEALHAEVEYPDFAREVGIEGRVHVRFVVSEEGDVLQPKIVRGAHELLNEEALRAVRALECTPGRQRGEPVKVRMTLPVVFQLGESR